MRPFGFSQSLRRGLLFSALILRVLAGTVTASDATSKSIVPATKETGRRNEHGISSVIPKAFQKNPELELTVVTELTEEGKKLPPVSPEQPAFFLLHSLGYKQIGGVSAAEKTVEHEAMEQLLLRGLATNGYRPAQLPEAAPSLVIYYYWGTQYVLTGGNSVDASLPADEIRRNILGRAALVGGRKFAAELHRMMREADDFADSAADPAVVAFANPVNLFRLKSEKNEFLLNQIAGDIYYVVASAYDYRSVAENQKTLLWRTCMTVGSQGVSQTQSLPTLVMGAAPFFGRETNGTEIIFKRALREGSVEMGVPTVVSDPPAGSALVPSLSEKK